MIKTKHWPATNSSLNTKISKETIKRANITTRMQSNQRRRVDLILRNRWKYSFRKTKKSLKNMEMKKPRSTTWCLRWRSRKSRKRRLNETREASIEEIEVTREITEKTVEADVMDEIAGVKRRISPKKTPKSLESTSAKRLPDSKTMHSVKGKA